MFSDLPNRLKITEVSPFETQTVNAVAMVTSTPLGGGKGGFSKYKIKEHIKRKFHICN
jgi:hypothetical protein